ncbi:MAG TPA: hypothetical protein VEH27_00620 [Methylomirabilota bacterium]|nr:hypothetical protein [Methylomirabilota bacterium]
MKCPHCGKDISYTVKKFVKARAVKAGMKGGAAGKGSEARRLAAKKAIEARWAKYRAKKAGEQGVRED